MSERCRDCGPGYWIGDEGCRHTATTERVRLTTAEKYLARALDAEERLRDLAAKVEALAEEWETPGADAFGPMWAAKLRALLADALPQDAAERPGNGAQSAEQTSGASLDVRDAAGLSEAHSGSEVGLADCGRRHPGMCAMVGGVCLQPVAETRDGGAGL